MRIAKPRAGRIEVIAAMIITAEGIKKHFGFAKDTPENQAYESKA